MAGGHFFSCSGPDTTKIGTDLTVINTAFMECQNGMTCWGPPQDTPHLLWLNLGGPYPSWLGWVGRILRWGGNSPRVHHDSQTTLPLTPCCFGPDRSKYKCYLACVICFLSGWLGRGGVKPRRVVCVCVCVCLSPLLNVAGWPGMGGVKPVYVYLCCDFPVLVFSRALGGAYFANNHSYIEIALADIS